MKIKSLIALPLLLAVAAPFVQSCAPKAQEVTLQVKTAAGVVEGFDQDGVKTFLGIPFAASPVGDLRWKAPQPVEAWEGVREAKAFGDDPMQPIVYADMIFRGPQRSEDCLYLNVWTTAGTDADKLPVLIYFNGGGLMAGSGSEPRYDGASISREGVIGVTANYREGIFGFFAHPELSAESPYGGSGNYGFLDQVAAIKWVKENIRAFGGDPDKITIAGESAGSFSVSLLMTSPLSKGLIAGAILSSGAEVMPFGAASLAEAEAAGEALLKTGATLEGQPMTTIAEARALDAEKLQEMFPPRGMANVVLDGYFMEESADAVFEKGEQAQVPLLAGWNSLEGHPASFFAMYGDKLTFEKVVELIKARFGDMTEEILAAYGIASLEDVFSQKGIDFASDLFTGFPTWKACDYHATTCDKPVYRYKFFRARPEEHPAPGAVHSADIEYAMGNLATNKVYDWQDEDYAISKLFLNFYANFCKNGDPNGEGLPEWTPINGNLDAAPVMRIDVESAESADPAVENAYRTLEKFYRKSL